MAFQQNQSLAYAQQNFPISAEDKPVIAVSAVTTGLTDAYFSKDKVPSFTTQVVTINTEPNLGINSNATTWAINVKGSNTVVN